MDHDDILTAFKSAQNPVLDEIRRIDDLTGRGELQRIAREDQQQPHWASPVLADFQAPSIARTARDAHDMLSESVLPVAIARNARDAQVSARDDMERFSVANIAATHRAFCASLATNQTIAEAALHAGGALNDAQARLMDLVDTERVSREMTQLFGEPLTGYARLVADMGPRLAASQRGGLGDDIFSAIDRDFNQLKHLAVALDPLQNLARALTASLGSSLTLAELQDHLDSRRWVGLDAGWVREYQSFAAMIDATWDRDSQDEHVDDGNDLDAGEVEETDARTVDNRELEESVRAVALHYAPVAWELNERLTRLAGRIDPTVHSGNVSWDRMILAIGRAHPTHAETLMLLTDLLLQALDLVRAPQGPRMNGVSESLGLDEVERFKALAFAMIDVLKEIDEESHGNSSHSQ